MGSDQSYYPRASFCLTQAVMIKKYISSGISLLSCPHCLRGKWHLGYRLLTVGHTLKKAFYLKISYTKYQLISTLLSFFLITSKTLQYTYIIIVSSYGEVCVCVCVAMEKCVCVCVCVCERERVVQLGLTLCDLMNCSSPGSSVHGIL